MKLSKLTAIYPALNALAACDLPSGPGFDIAMALTKAKDAQKAYEDQNIKLLRKFGVASDRFERSFTFPDVDKRVEYDEHHDKLLEKECDLVLPTFKRADLGDFKVKPMVLADLAEMFTGGTTKDEALAKVQSLLANAEARIRELTAAQVEINVNVPAPTEVSVS